MENRIKTKIARDEFGSVVNRVAYGKERFILERRNKEMAAIIPMEEYRLLEEYVAQLEDKIDLEAAKAALSEPGENIPFEVVLREANGLSHRDKADGKARVGKAARK
ncbi:MAG: type II toxin-antitoxin system Phd/YefM family antitoxin [bacterium]